jgi:hypothetical protein
MWKIRPERIREVWARAATIYVDSDVGRAGLALQLTFVSRSRDGSAGKPLTGPADFRSSHSGYSAGDGPVSKWMA